MSQATPREDTYQCSYCGGSYAVGHAVEGSYCSALCYYHDRGNGVINQIDAEHQLCSTCYGRVKTVEPAPEDAPGDGFQYPTPRTTIGIDDFGDTPRTPARWSHWRLTDAPENTARKDRRVESTRWSCACGAVDPNQRDATIQNIDLSETVANFYRAMCFLHDRGAIPHTPDRERYFAALEDRWRDAAYAAGRAIYG